MKKALVDVNVWLALLTADHIHHREARNWYGDVSAGAAGLCRVAQLSVVRLLGNPAVTKGRAVPASEAWDATIALLEDERVQFVSEPPDLDIVLPTLFRYRSTTPKLVPDAYLAAFAIQSSRALVTFDAGLSQFPGLDLQLLGR